MEEKLQEEIFVHCSTCEHYETMHQYMFCKILERRITARKKPCNNYSPNKQIYPNSSKNS